MNSAAFTPCTPADLKQLPVLPGRAPFFGHMMRLFFRPDKVIRKVDALKSDFVWVQARPGGWHLQVRNPEHFNLLRSKSATNRHYAELANLLLGRSLLTRDGKVHRVQRASMNSPFTPKGLRAAGTSAIMKETIEERVAALIARPKFTALTQTRSLALDIIFRILGIPGRELEQWREHYEEMLFATFPLKWEFPYSPAWRAIRGRNWISTAIQRRLDAVRADPNSEGLLAEMVRGWDASEEREDDSVLIDNILLLGLAGHETTASTMAWMVCHLAASPNLFARALNEVEGVGAIPATPAELIHFPLIEGIFRECLRLYPPVPFVSRALVEPVQVGGVELPAGVEVSFPILLWQRNASRYPDPERFLPDRWIGLPRKPEPLDNIGFSFGPHFCLGYHVAWMEAVQFGVGLVLELARQNKRLKLFGRFPKPRYFGLCQPKKHQTRVRVTPA